MNDFPKFKIILGAVVFWLFCIIGSTAFSQDRVLEYKPTPLEKTIIDAISASKAAGPGRLEYSERISMAIGRATDTLQTSSDSIVDLIFKSVGGFHMFIVLDSTALHDSRKMVADVIRQLPLKGHYAIKSISVGGRDALIVYYTDIYLLPDPGHSQGVTPALYSYMPAYYCIQYTATINADTIKHVLYKGDMSFTPQVDSIAKVTVTPVVQNRVKIFYEFEKMSAALYTVNVYAYSIDRKCYDLMEIYFPPKTNIKGIFEE